MRTHLLVVAAVAGASLAFSAPARAATSINSSAFDISINLTVARLVGVGLGPLTEAAGLAPDGYSDFDQTLSLNQNLNIGTSILGLRERIRTGVMTTTAVSPLPVSQFGRAVAEVDDLNSRLGLLVANQFGNLLTISADTVLSRSSVSAPGGVASAIGFTQLEGLRLSGSLLGNTTINGSLFVNPDPNTVLFTLGVLGQETLKIILNEQVKTGNGTNSGSVSTNAIRIIFANLAVGNLGLLSGEIIVAHSQAEINDAVAVPEPATWVQMIAGFGLIGAITRRSRRRIAAA